MKIWIKIFKNKIKILKNIYILEKNKKNEKWVKIFKIKKHFF